MLSLFLHSTLLLALSGTAVLVVFKLSRIRSVRVVRFAWAAVLCSGVLWFRFPVNVPVYENKATEPYRAPISQPEPGIPVAGSLPEKDPKLFLPDLLPNRIDLSEPGPTVVSPVPEPEHRDDANLVLRESEPIEPAPAEKPGSIEPVLSDHSVMESTDVIGPLLASKPSAGTLFFLFWLFGTLAIALRRALAWSAVRADLERCTEIEPGSSPQWDRLLKEHGIAPETIRLFLSETYGPGIVRRPGHYAIIVPKALWDDFPDHVREGILRHELAHYRYRDPLKSFVAHLLKTLHWFNPMAHFAAARFDEAAEWRCDHEAFGKTGQGSGDLAETFLALRDSRPVSVWIGSRLSRSKLVTRVRKLDESLEKRKESPMKKLSIIVFVLLLLGLGVLRVRLTVRSAAEETKPRQESTSLTAQESESGEKTVTEFLDALRENRYDKATALFTEELLSRCNERQLRARFEKMKLSELNEAAKPGRRSRDRTKAGLLQSFDKPKRTDHPGGPLWETILRYENGNVLIRLALQPAGDRETLLAAFELTTPSGETFPEDTVTRFDGPEFFNAPEIVRKLRGDCSIEIEVLGPDGKHLSRDQFQRLGIFLFVKTDEEKEAVFTHRGEANRWTDPRDGTHWLLYRDVPGHSFLAKAEDFRTILCDTLPTGTYRIATTNAQDGSVENEGYVVFSEPVVLDAVNRHRKIVLSLRNGGTLRIVVRDTETGEISENVYFKRLGTDTAPTQISGAWVCHNMRTACNGLFPGRYTFTVQQYPGKPDDRVFDLDETEYKAEIVDGKETVVEVDLPGRTQTKEELDARWPFLIAGTVRDLNGEPVPHATITIMGFLGHRPGRASITADENGRYHFRFAKAQVVAMWVLRSEKATPEKPDVLKISLSAERPGYAWKGIRKDDDTLDSNQFLKISSSGRYSRSDFHLMACSDPEPTASYKETAGFDRYNVVYAHRPATIDIVLQSAVRFRGVLPFDEPVEPADPKDRRAMTRCDVTFDLPRAERASYQPVFYGSLEETDGLWHFDVSAPPYEIDAFLDFSAPLPASWKEDVTVTKTDLFKLPVAGDYTVKLRWDRQERDGRIRRKLAIDSVTDSNGRPVALGETKPVFSTDYLLNRWTIEGTVRDDQGAPVEGAEVEFARHDSWEFRRHVTVETDAAGRYRAELPPGNRYPYGHELHGPENGELIALRVRKEGFAQKDFDKDRAIFLSDKVDHDLETFTYKKYSTQSIVPQGKPLVMDVVLNRNAVLEGILTGKDGRPLAGYDLRLQNDTDRYGEREKNFGFTSERFRTDEDGRFIVERSIDDRPFWFRLSDDHPGEKDMLRTDNLILSPGDRYRVNLQLDNDEDGTRRLSIRSVRDIEGDDVTKKLVRKDRRTNPELNEEETKKGREIIDRLGGKTRPMFGITNNSVAGLHYRFHRGETVREIKPDSYSGQRNNETKGITCSTPLEDLVARPWNVSFRSIERKDDEIRLYTTSMGRYAYGNGISETWAGYAGGGCGEVLVVLDAETGLPKRVEGAGLREEYYDWTPLGDDRRGEFVPLRILVRCNSMNFDFRFKIHEGDLWLFDRSVVPDGQAEKTICRIDEVRIERFRWVPEEEERRVRDALKEYGKVNEYWLSRYPKDLPEFGYTFHMQGHDDEVLSYEEIKAATNWFAEFKRKGISYIGLSRLLVLDIDALRCRRVVEDKEAGTLEFDFVLKHAWMNAVGNGVSGTWLGWFNGGIDKGTAVLDTKTMTLREVRTMNYDERYSDYVPVKPGRYVPRRIVIDKHNGDRSKSGQGDNMLFDFRFQVYEPCLWLFDRSVQTDETGKEKTDYPVWIDKVTVNGETAVPVAAP